MSRWGTGLRYGLFGLIITAGVLLLVGVIGVGVLFYKAYIPERMTLSGRVIDGSGKPIPSAKITAVPIPVHLDFSEDPINTRAIVYSAICDPSGQFRLDRMIAAGGVKEGMWIQAYELQISASGYRRALIPFRRPSNQKGDLKIPDIVMGISPVQ